MKIRAKLLIPLAALFSSAGVKPRFMETNARINRRAINVADKRTAILRVRFNELLDGVFL